MLLSPRRHPSLGSCVDRGHLPALDYEQEQVLGTLLPAVVAPGCGDQGPEMARGPLLHHQGVEQPLWKGSRTGGCWGPVSSPLVSPSPGAPLPRICPTCWLF